MLKAIALRNFASKAHFYRKGDNVIETANELTELVNLGFVHIVEDEPTIEPEKKLIRGEGKPKNTKRK